MNQVWVYMVIALVILTLSLWSYLRGKDRGIREAHDVCQDFITRIQNAVNETLTDDERKEFINNMIDGIVVEITKGDDGDD